MNLRVAHVSGALPPPAPQISPNTQPAPSSPPLVLIGADAAFNDLLHLGHLHLVEAVRLCALEERACVRPPGLCAPALCLAPTPREAAGCAIVKAPRQLLDGLISSPRSPRDRQYALEQVSLCASFPICKAQGRAEALPAGERSDVKSFVNSREPYTHHYSKQLVLGRGWGACGGGGRPCIQYPSVYQTIFVSSLFSLRETALTAGWLGQENGR